MPVGTGGSFGGATERYCRLHELLSLGFARPSKAYEFRIFEHQFGLFRPILGQAVALTFRNWYLTDMKKLQEFKMHLTRREEVTDKGLMAICCYIPKAWNFLLFLSSWMHQDHRRGPGPDCRRFTVVHDAIEEKFGLQKLAATKAFFSSNLKRLTLDFDGFSICSVQFLHSWSIPFGA